MNLTAIAIVALSCWALVSIVTAFADKSGKKLNDKEKARLEGEISSLKDRVETLEKIVTDESYNLKKEIEALDKDRAA
ncbi:hypothetical protein DRW07_16550 [Alteromonas sediminis]|uniref:Uncharacterized protein n=1 Tax=Alteromonas sediminis TaxID=2259342 RepID=A0A3N5XWE6_9ALTE|nr:hypothetical protein [Alteromonas sediminis]RPJ64932.1 hypothetical protein DRW07_16550 [Alteromonas sediminis]